MRWNDPLEKLIPWVPKGGRQFFAAFLVVFLGYVVWQVVT